MAISDTITSMYENVGNVYDVLELAGADLTNVDKNIENLKQSWEERLLYFLANGTDVVWNNWLPKVTGSGETITLNNTIEAKMDFVYKGNTSQYSTTGKNLFDKSKISSVSGGTNNNGIITATNGNCSVFLSSGGYIPVNNGETIYFSADIKLNSSSSGVWNNINDGVNGGTKKILYPTLSTTYQRYQTSFTYSSNVSIDRLFIQNFNLSGSIEISNIMISKNNNANYEPYTNGASPNPDYPQDIQVVSGDNTIKVAGKNLFDISTITENKTIDLDTGEVNVNANDRNTSDFILVTNSVTYSCNVTMTRIAYYDENKTFISSSGTITSIVTPNNCKYVRFSYDNSLSNIQFERGYSSSFTPYATSYPIDLGNIELCKIGDYQDRIAKSSGKNLFDKDNANIAHKLAKNDLTFNTDSNYVSIYVPAQEGKTYTISSTSNLFDTYASLFFTSEDLSIATTCLSVSKRSSGATSITATAPAGTKYVCAYIMYSNNQTDINNLLSTIQIELGNQVTPYEPYGKVWYLNKQIGKVVLDGSENWVHEAGSQTPTPRTVVTINSINFLNNNYYSNYFILNSTTSNRIVLQTVNSQLYLSLENELTGIINSDTNQQKVDKIKSWLSNNNTIVYYVLATPTTTEITDTTLISQLEAIKKSYNNQTNISQTNASKPFILDVVALGELEI